MPKYVKQGHREAAATYQPSADDSAKSYRNNARHDTERLRDNEKAREPQHKKESNRPQLNTKIDKQNTPTLDRSYTNNKTRKGDHLK